MHAVLRARAKPKLLWFQPVPRLGEGKNYVILRHICHAVYSLLVRPLDAPVIPRISYEFPC